MQRKIDNYEDVSLIDTTILPIKASMNTLCTLLELGTDALEEVRLDVKETAEGERKLMKLKTEVKIAKYNKILQSYKPHEEEEVEL